MTRKEQLACLIDLPCNACKYHDTGCYRWKCVFEEMQTDAEPCEDCISRAEAIKAIEEYGSVWMEYTEEMSVHQIAERALKASKQSMYKILHDLPSIQPTTKENLAVPMSVIEDIKAEIETDLSMFCFDDWGNENGSWTAIKEIIDKHISGKER